MRLIGCFFFLLVAGCAGVGRAPPESSTPPPEMAATEPAKPGPVDAAVARTEPPAAGIPAKPPAEPPVTKPVVPPVPAKKKEAPPPLDLTSLETRLKETKAIGVFTKITIKNQVDDLLEQFRAYYQGRAKTTLAELRRPYDGLVLKVLSLLQDGDPELARAVLASREAIWGILADPNKFATL